MKLFKKDKINAIYYINIITDGDFNTFQKLTAHRNNSSDMDNAFNYLNSAPI